MAKPWNTGAAIWTIRAKKKKSDNIKLQNTSRRRRNGSDQNSSRKKNVSKSTDQITRKKEKNLKISLKASDDPGT